MSGALDGLLVVALEQAVAAPYASCRLADAGARVIKIERPSGDFAREYDTLAKGESAYFVWLNRGKESICLDLREADHKAIFTEMLSRADVFIQNLKPQALEKLGFSLDEIRQRNKRLICCNITGFGKNGPLSKLKAYDLIVQGEVGLCAITGTADGPARVGVSVCDIAAGMTAHSAVLQALYSRERTGAGCVIDVSLFDALADWMNVPYIQQVYGGRKTVRSGVKHPSLAPYGAFESKDGVNVILSVQNEAEWSRFCSSMKFAEDLFRMPQFAANMGRLQHRAELEQVIEAHFKTLDAAEIIKRLEEGQIAYGRLNGIDELAVHPHLRTLKLTTAAGEMHVIAPAAIVDGECSGAEHVPTRGQHDDLLFSEFGEQLGAATNS